VDEGGAARAHPENSSGVLQKTAKKGGAGKAGRDAI